MCRNSLVGKFQMTSNKLSFKVGKNGAQTDNYHWHRTDRLTIAACRHIHVCMNGYDVFDKMNCIQDELYSRLDKVIHWIRATLSSI